MSDGFRDDTATPFSLTGAGPVFAFDMPPPRQFCPRRELVQRMVAALAARDDVAYDEAFDRLIELREPNSNSGPAAPIQGQG